MKIDRSSSTFIEQLGLREDKQAGDLNRPAFKDILALSGDRMQKTELDRLLQSIDQLGRELAKQCSWRTLTNYRERIRRFLQEIVKGSYGMRERQGFDRRGRLKLYKIISELDSVMAELAQEVLLEEKNELEILKKIGDIRGILVNLYT